MTITDKEWSMLNLLADRNTYKPRNCWLIYRISAVVEAYECGLCSQWIGMSADSITEHGRMHLSQHGLTAFL